MPSTFVIAVLVLVGFFTLLYFKGKHAAKGNIQAGAEFLANNAQQENITVTASGLQYQVLTSSDETQHPTARDTVTVHYTGTLLDGTVFDSSVNRGQTISFPLNQVIPGWTEGVQLMVVGEKTRFFIPSRLAYGNRSAGAIKPGSTLIFDVELFEIQ